MTYHKSLIAVFCLIKCKVSDLQRQTFNYVVRVSRVLVEYFDALKPLKDVYIQYIPHKHSKQMPEKSTKVKILFVRKT